MVGATEGLRAGLVALLAILACVSPSLAQGGAGTWEAAPPPPAPSRASPTAAEAADELTSFVNDSAMIAGAVAVCSPDGYTAVRLCTILVVNHWAALGNRPPRDARGMPQRLETAWQRAAGQSRNRQASPNPPSTCSDLLEQVRRLPFWQTCEAAQRVQAQVEAQARPGPRREPPPAGDVSSGPRTGGTEQERPRRDVMDLQ